MKGLILDKIRTQVRLVSAANRGKRFLRHNLFIFCTGGSFHTEGLHAEECCQKAGLHQGKVFFRWKRYAGTPWRTALIIPDFISFISVPDVFLGTGTVRFTG
jgi:hypothetical protein